MEMKALESGPTMIFTGDVKVEADAPTMPSAIASEMEKSSPPPKACVMTSMGNKTRTVSMLKASCTVAPMKPYMNSFLSRMWPCATMVLVTEVPMLAPMIMGIAAHGHILNKKEFMYG